MPKVKPSKILYINDFICIRVYTDEGTNKVDGEGRNIYSERPQNSE
jgi:hypothetical protein